MSETGILVEYKGKVAVITLNVPKKLNALNGDLYYQLARAMHEVAAHDEVFITVLTGKGRFFSAYVFPSPPFYHCTPSLRTYTDTNPYSAAQTLLSETLRSQQQTLMSAKCG